VNSKIKLSNIALTVFCTVGLYLSLLIVHAVTYPWLYIPMDSFGWNSATQAGTTVVGAGLASFYIGKSSPKEIVIGSICVGLLYAGFFLNVFPVHNLQERMEPVSTSVSIVSMSVAGALLGGHLVRRWHSPALMRNSLVSTVVVTLVVLGTTYLSFLSFFLIALIAPFALPLFPLFIIFTFVFSPIVTGYMIQPCTRRSDVTQHFFFALFILTTLACILVAAAPYSDFSRIIITFIICFVGSGLYFLLAKVGITKAVRRNAGDLPTVPTAKVVL